MKEAMWKVDPLGEFSFSDATDPNQRILFPNQSMVDLDHSFLYILSPPDEYPSNAWRILSMTRPVSPNSHGCGVAAA